MVNQVKQTSVRKFKFRQRTLAQVMLPNINKHWNIFVPTSVMLKLSQTIYKHYIIVNSKINENAPKSHKYSLALLNLTNAYTAVFTVRNRQQTNHWLCPCHYLPFIVASKQHIYLKNRKKTNKKTKVNPIPL